MNKSILKYIAFGILTVTVYQIVLMVAGDGQVARIKTLNNELKLMQDRHAKLYSEIHDYAVERDRVIDAVRLSNRMLEDSKFELKRVQTAKSELEAPVTAGVSTFTTNVEAYTIQILCPTQYSVSFIQISKKQ